MNDNDRNQWIDNDEGLYNWWLGSGKSKKNFIKENRAQISEIIDNVTGGKKKAHYLVYG